MVIWLKVHLFIGFIYTYSIIYNNWKTLKVKHDTSHRRRYQITQTKSFERTHSTLRQQDTTTTQNKESGPHLLMHSFHFRVTSCPSEARAWPAARRGGVRLGPLVGPPGRGNKDLCLPQYGAIWGGDGKRERGGGVHVAAVVPPMTAVGRRGCWAVGDRNRSGSVTWRRRGFELVGQDEFSEFGASGVTLGGDVHVGGVSSQQPRRQQREGYTSSATVDLKETQRETF